MGGPGFTAAGGPPGGGGRGPRCPGRPGPGRRQGAVGRQPRHHFFSINHRECSDWNARGINDDFCIRRNRYIHQSHIRRHHFDELHVELRLDWPHIGHVEHVHRERRCRNTTRAHHECCRIHLRQRLHHPARGGDS
ncbi:MAG: hypothetical protein EBU23_17505 [Mycobacteriaceae bacterium]|nr:hypothetical protein [Mycobacteriaceae bacterium]